MSALRNETLTRLAAEEDGTVAAFVRTPTDRCAHAHRYEDHCAHAHRYEDHCAHAHRYEDRCAYAHRYEAAARPESRGEGGA